MRRPVKRISDAGLIFGYVFGIFGLAIALFLPFSINGLGTDRLIEYDGTITFVERVNRLSRYGSKNRVRVTINYDGGHVETHSIRSSLKSSRLDEISKSLEAHNGQPVIVSFLPNDRTIAEIKTTQGEILLDQEQLRAATHFTSWGMGGLCAIFLALMIVLHVRRPTAGQEGSVI